MEYKFTTPIKMPRSTHYGNNYWIFESRKLHRQVTAYSNLEYENLLTLEMNPEVEYYCEQPYSATVFVDGKESKTIFDAYVVYKNGREEFQEVKYQQELDSDSEQGERCQKQIEIQKKWSEQNNFLYILRTNNDIEKGPHFIRNLSLLAVKARRFSTTSKESDQSVISYLSNIKRTTIGLLAESGKFETFLTLDYLADLFYRGIIRLEDIHNDCICNKTEVIFCDIQKIQYQGTTEFT